MSALDQHQSTHSHGKFIYLIVGAIYCCGLVFKTKNDYGLHTTTNEHDDYQEYLKEEGNDPTV
jgi:hypothetical protein